MKIGTDKKKKIMTSREKKRQFREVNMIEREVKGKK